MFFSSNTIRYKLIRSYFIIIIVPIIIMSFSVYFILSKIVEKKLSDSMLNTITQININIENVMLNVENLSDYYYFRNPLQNSLKSNADDNIEKFKSFVMSYRNMNDYTAIIGFDGRTFITWPNDSSIYYKINKIVSSKDWYNKLINMNGKVLWIPTHYNFDKYADDKYVFTAGRLLLNMNDWEKKYGILLISIPEISISNILKQYRTLNDSFVFVVDPNGTVVSHIDKNMVMVNIKNKDYFKQITSKNSGQFITFIDGKKMLIVFERIAKNGWITAAAIPVKELGKEIKIFTYAIIISGIIGIILALILSYFISYGISKPIKILENEMDKVQNGNFNAYVDIKTNDEIERIGNKFNIMTAKVKQLNALQIKQKDIELQLLRAQINPHFLFNTLNSIKCMAIINADQHIAKMIGALGKLLENSIRRGNEIITVNEEMENVKNYVLLQQMRYGSKLRVSYDIQSEIMHLKVPKLILQPIVENAIIHGIGTKANGGQILISGRLEKEYLILSVKDDGEGMTEDYVKQLLQHKVDTDRKKKFNGIGIKNIDERIKLLYGDNYGIQINSVLREGTRVQVYLPII